MKPVVARCLYIAAAVALAGTVVPTTARQDANARPGILRIESETVEVKLGGSADVVRNSAQLFLSDGEIGEMDLQRLRPAYAERMWIWLVPAPFDRDGGMLFAAADRVGGLAGAAADKQGGLSGAAADKSGGLAGAAADKSGGLAGAAADKSGGLTGAAADKQGGATGAASADKKGGRGRAQADRDAGAERAAAEKAAKLVIQGDKDFGQLSLADREALGLSESRPEKEIVSESGRRDGSILFRITINLPKTLAFKYVVLTDWVDKRMTFVKREAGSPGDFKTYASKGGTLLVWRINPRGGKISFSYRLK